MSLEPNRGASRGAGHQDAIEHVFPMPAGGEPERGFFYVLLDRYPPGSKPAGETGAPMRVADESLMGVLPEPPRC
jgi:hypothetical protein